MTTRISGMYSGLDTDTLIKQLTSSYKKKIDTATKTKKTTELKQTAWSALNSKIYSFYSGAASKMRYKNNSNQNTVTKSSSNALSVTGANVGISNVKIISMAQTAQVTGMKLNEKFNKQTTASELGLSSGTYKFNNSDIEINDTDTISTIVEKLQKTGVNANFDESQHRLYISSKKPGTENEFNLEENATDQELLLALGIPPQTYFKDGKYYKDALYSKLITDDETLNKIRNGAAAIRKNATNAEIMVDGATYESNDNTFNINGATYTINNKSDENITVTTTKDNSGLYNTVKSFISEYNAIINEMTKSYNTTNKGYTPLTEDEEESMTEKQIEKWNEVLNDSALYKDSRLYDVINSLKTVMNQGVKMSDGTTMYLSNFGIGTGNYLSTDKNERNAYHIDGEDDLSSKTNKLKDMIENDPEKVEEFFSKLATQVYDKLTNEMKSTSYSSMYKVYNDKQLSTQYTKQQTDIDKLQKKMTQVEEKYYKQFAKMEEMLAKIQSQTNAIGNFFNTSI